MNNDPKSLQVQISVIDIDIIKELIDLLATHVDDLPEPVRHHLEKISSGADND